MKKISLLILSALTITTAHALDSDWRLCKGEVVIFDKHVNLVVNVFEHRVSESRRQADLMMIYGGNVLKGNIETTNATRANTVLKGFKSTYKGDVSIDYGTNTLSLNGELALGASVSSLQANLDCQVL